MRSKQIRRHKIDHKTVALHACGLIMGRDISVIDRCGNGRRHVFAVFIKKYGIRGVFIFEFLGHRCTGFAVKLGVCGSKFAHEIVEHVGVTAVADIGIIAQ